jgi:hypothetical protein
MQAVPTDATTIDSSQFVPIAFALIDIDLYRPVRRSSTVSIHI